MYPHVYGCLCTPTEQTVRKKPRTQIYANKGSMATARKQSLRAGMGRESAGRCRACAHDGHAWAWRMHAMNMYSHAKCFVDFDFVHFDAAGNFYFDVCFFGVTLQRTRYVTSVDQPFHQILLSSLEAVHEMLFYVDTAHWRAASSWFDRTRENIKIGKTNASESEDELRLAAEMGQLILSQKKELQHELDVTAIERDMLKRELKEWALFAEKCGAGLGEVSRSSAANILMHAQERAELLEVDASDQRQRVVQLEVRCADLESANALLALKSDASARQQQDLKKAKEAFKGLSEALAARLQQGFSEDLAARLQHELCEMRCEKQCLSDKISMLEANLRQFEDELFESQENLLNTRVEYSKFKRLSVCRDTMQATENIHGQGVAESVRKEQQSRDNANRLEEHAQALETIEALKLEIASIRFRTTHSAEQNDQDVDAERSAMLSQSTVSEEDDHFIDAQFYQVKMALQKSEDRVTEMATKVDRLRSVGAQQTDLTYGLSKQLANTAKQVRKIPYFVL